MELQTARLAMILSGIDMSSAHRRKWFQPTGEIPENQGESDEDQTVLCNQDV